LTRGFFRDILAGSGLAAFEITACQFSRRLAMYRISVAVMLLWVTALAFAADEDPNEAELKKLEGDWQLTRQEERGALTPKPVVERLRIVIEGNEMAWYIGNPASNQTADIKVNAKANPKTIDAEITKNSAIGKTMLGIYKLDKDTLEICVRSANCVFDLFLLAAKLKPSHREVQGDGEAAEWGAGSVLAGAGSQAGGEPAERAAVL
jgi:uncharacterized protein (TIGR03067 family)